MHTKTGFGEAGGTLVFPLTSSQLRDTVTSESQFNHKMVDVVQVSSKLEVHTVHVILTIWHAPTNAAILHILIIELRKGLLFFLFLPEGSVLVIRAVATRISRKTATTDMIMPRQILWVYTTTTTKGSQGWGTLL
jgi:hypothetical protein